jgi:hypothetical protein
MRKSKKDESIKSVLIAFLIAVCVFLSVSLVNIRENLLSPEESFKNQQRLADHYNSRR